MRIVAWNCCRCPIAKKLGALEALQPDVAVLSEAVEPIAESDQLLWFPSNASRLGIQVRAFGRHKLKRLKSADLPNCVVPVRVSGDVNFNLLAVWTWPAPSYTKAFLNGLRAYASLIRRGPTVVAQLHDAGLVSAYHEFTGAGFGSEPHATHHFLRRPERPFHIDFCFVPRAWAEQRLDARVVSGPEWSALSDHFPLVVDTHA
jgi:exodeoxyribonuclease III